MARRSASRPSSRKPSRSHQRDGYTTVREHLPEAHRQYLDWTPARLLEWAAGTGPHTAAVIAHLLNSRAHVLQALQSGLGIVRLGQTYGADRLEAAAARALLSGAVSYRSLASILDHGLDRQPWAPPPDPLTPITHTNLRGAQNVYVYAIDNAIRIRTNESGPDAIIDRMEDRKIVNAKVRQAIESEQRDN